MLLNTLYLKSFNYYVKMLIKLLFSTITLLLSSISLNAQTDCKDLLAHKINLFDDLEKTQLELTTNFSKLTYCGLDQTDIVFFWTASFFSNISYWLVKRGS